MVHTMSMWSHLAKITTILNENGHFHKTSTLTQTSKNHHVHKNYLFSYEKCTQNAEGPNLACRWGPNLACQGCQARLSSFSGQKAPNSTGHPVFLTMQVLDNTPAVLSLGKLCDENGFSYEWINGQKPHLIKDGIRIICNTENFVPIVVPGLSSSSSGSFFINFKDIHETGESFIFFILSFFNNSK